MKNMNKRGQATLFIILGIVLVVLVVLYFVGVQQKIIPPILGGSSANEEMNDVENHIKGCLEEVGNDYVTILGLQGGYLSPDEGTYRLYDDSKISYLCWNQVDTKTCTNRMLTEESMETELKQAMESALNTCVNVYDYSSDATIAEDWDLTVDIQRSSVDFVLYYPVQIVKGDDVASQDVVNDHAIYGDFEQLIYMLSKLSRYTIYKNKPYPDVLYQVKLREGDYVFQFAIQGEEKV